MKKILFALVLAAISIPLYALSNNPKLEGEVMRDGQVIMRFSVPVKSDNSEIRVPIKHSQTHRYIKDNIRTNNGFDMTASSYDTSINMQIRSSQKEDGSLGIHFEGQNQEFWGFIENDERTNSNPMLNVKTMNSHTTLAFGETAQYMLSGCVGAELGDNSCGYSVIIRAKN